MFRHTTPTNESDGYSHKTQTHLRDYRSGFCLANCIAFAAAEPDLSGRSLERTLERLLQLTNAADSLLSVLAAGGIVEGKNLVFVQRYAEGHIERLGGLATELKAENVDVIVTLGYPAALAAKVSAKGVPIVVTGAGDPVATGLVDGLARPGGDLTGVTELSTDLSAERLEILKDAVPSLRRVAMLWNTDDLGMTLRYHAADDAARVLGVKVQALGVREPDDFNGAFA